MIMQNIEQDPLIIYSSHALFNSNIANSNKILTQLILEGKSWKQYIFYELL